MLWQTFFRGQNCGQDLMTTNREGNYNRARTQFPGVLYCPLLIN
jgi:hypothetical protein